MSCQGLELEGCLVTSQLGKGTCGLPCLPGGRVQGVGLQEGGWERPGPDTHFQGDLGQNFHPGPWLSHLSSRDFGPSLSLLPTLKRMHSVAWSVGGWA